MLKTCKICGNEFHPARPLQAVCGFMCAKKAAKQYRASEKETLKKRKADLKTIPELIKEAQHEFNAYIRARDENQYCICCGKVSLSSASHVWDAGHYRSTSSASHLRFNEDNVHRQLVVCNRHGAGRAVDYRIGLLERIGEERVLALEQNNNPHKWTREELIQIKETYRQKLKELKEKV